MRQEIHRIFHRSEDKTKGKKAPDIPTGSKVMCVFTSLDMLHGTHSLGQPGCRRNQNKIKEI